jgi:hypothetical protein
MNLKESLFNKYTRKCLVLTNLSAQPKKCSMRFFWAHSKVGHKKTFSTFKALDKKFANITRTTVTKFIAMCPICASTTRSDIGRKKCNGPGIAIKSLSFKDRIQVDLINFTSSPAVDHNEIPHDC